MSKLNWQIKHVDAVVEHNGKKIKEIEIWEKQEYGSFLVTRTIGHTTPDYLSRAKLICAAPELLEACEMIVQAVDSGDPDGITHSIDACNEAIAKAKGNTND